VPWQLRVAEHQEPFAVVSCIGSRVPPELVFDRGWVTCLPSGPAPGAGKLEPGRVAVVLVDFQNDFCRPSTPDQDPAQTQANAEAARRANGAILFARRWS
jgi:hypothetical protein